MGSVFNERRERVLELGLTTQAAKVRAGLAIFLLALVVGAPAKLVSNVAPAFCAVALLALLSIWTLFFLNWQVVWARGQLPLVATAVLLADVGSLSLFIYGTGGFHSPFASLLLLPVLFGAVFFGSLSAALPLVAGVVAAVHVSFAVGTPWEPGITWQLSGRLISVIAIAWLSYGLSRVLERERRANESVVRNLTEGVLLIDGAKSIVLANPQIEKVCQLSQDMILGQRIDSVPREADYERLLEVVADVGRAGRGPMPITRDHTLQVPEAIDLRITTIPCGGSSARPLGWVVVCQDVTDIKAVARMKEDGITILSHELRSPLATLRAVSQVLSTLADELDPEQRTQAIWAIEKETDRLIKLVSKLLDVSALEQGTQQLELEPVQVSVLIDKIVGIFEVTAPLRDISMISEYEEGLPEIRADGDRVEQVLTNLCENALKYTPEGGTVTVAAARHNNHVEISVSDTGCGIPAEQLEMIFGKFAQADAPSSIPLVERGMGLGLYIARTIVRRHGGDITVDSTVGQGSTFRVLLPVS